MKLGSGYRLGVFGVLVGLLTSMAVSIPSHAAPAKPPAPLLTLTIEKDGWLLFQWKRVKGATYYRLMVDEKETGQFLQIGDNIATTSKRYRAPERDILSDKEPQYRIDACNEGGCTPSGITSESQVNLLNAPMSDEMKKAFDDLLDGDKKKK